MGSATSHSTPRFSRPKRVMISRINNACSTRRWIARPCRSDGAVDGVVIGVPASVGMLANGRDQQADHAPGGQTDQKYREYGSEPPRLHRLVWQTGLHQALQVPLLP